MSLPHESMILPVRFPEGYSKTLQSNQGNKTVEETKAILPVPSCGCETDVM